MSKIKVKLTFKARLIGAQGALSLYSETIEASGERAEKLRAFCADPQLNLGNLYDWPEVKFIWDRYEHVWLRYRPEEITDQPKGAS